MRGIAKALDERGFATARGGPWSPARVQRLLNWLRCVAGSGSAPLELASLYCGRCRPARAPCRAGHGDRSNPRLSGVFLKCWFMQADLGRGHLQQRN
jgi:hypothetical protein